MKTLFTILIAVASFIMMAFVVPQDQKKPGPWEIPAKYKSMKSAVKADADTQKLGKALYAKHCRSCHGNIGAGDGPKAKNLETHPGDFSDAKFQAHADGELYYMAIVGRDEMPNFEKNIADEEERWAIISYLRTFKK
jgi:mono/diheme cytochrome c family protein